MRGRKPKPNELKILQGNPGRRKIQATPKPDKAVPDCPEWLPGEAKKEWARIVPELEKLGLVSRLDMAALSAYCCAWAQMKAAEELIEIEGMTIKTATGYLQSHPALGIASTAMKHVRAFAAVLGLSPSDRTRLPIEKPEKPNAFLEYLAKKNAQKYEASDA